MVELLSNYEEQVASSKNQRDAANELGIPRSTVRNWSDQKNKIPLPKVVVDCFESEDGFEFLHTLLIAIQFVMATGRVMRDKTSLHGNGAFETRLFHCLII